MMQALSTITKENPSIEDVVQMFKAFAQNFPSLSAINPLDVAHGHIEAIESACRDEQASQGGRWPAKVEVDGGRVAVIPYCGDRKFILRREYVIVDYSLRPTLAHSKALIDVAPEGAVVKMSDYWLHGGYVIVSSLEAAEELAQFCATLARKPLVATATKYWDEGFSFEIEQWGSSNLEGFDLSQGEAWFNPEPASPVSGSENMAEWLDVIWKEWKRGAHKISEPPMWLIKTLKIEREFAQKEFKATIPLNHEEFCEFIAELNSEMPRMVAETHWDGKCISTSKWEVVKKWMEFLPDEASIQLL